MIVTLPKDKVSEDVYLGHLMHISGAIPHDEELSNSFLNNITRTHLLVAEAFAAGLKAGRAETRNEGEGNE